MNRKLCTVLLALAFVSGSAQTTLQDKAAAEKQDVERKLAKVQALSKVKILDGPAVTSKNLQPTSKAVCDQIVASQDFRYGIEVTNPPIRVAIDVPVAAGQIFTLNDITLNLITKADNLGNTVEPRNVNFVLHKNKNGVPGDVIKSVGGEIITSDEVGPVLQTQGNYTGYVVNVRFEEPIVLSGSEATLYWLEIVSDASAYELSYGDRVGNLFAFNYDALADTSWEPSPAPADIVYTLGIDCEGDAPPLSYCQPYSECDDGDVIYNVTFNGIDNDSRCDSAVGFSDFTNISTSVEKGKTYPISVDVGNGTSHQNVMVYIDYNHDGYFTEDEYKYIGQNGGGTLKNTITIPETALTGPTRMRVRIQTLSPYTVGPTYAAQMACYENGLWRFGETEDYTVNITNNLAVIDAEAAGIKTYPNPVKDMFHIEGQENIKNVEVFDMSGKLLVSAKPNSKKAQLNLSSLKAGVYVVKMTTDKKTSSSKIVKQ